MTVNTTNITSGPYVGTGTGSTFSYDFRVNDKTQLSVYETDDAGNQILLVVDTDYTVAGVGVDGGGIITRVAGNLPVDYEWYIRSNYDDTQLTAFGSQGGFFPDVHEKALDKLTFIIQQQEDEAKRSLKLSNSDSSAETADMTLPGKEERSDRFLGFNSDGNPVATTAILTPVTPFMETLLDDADAAEARTTLEVGAGDSPAFAGLTVDTTTLHVDSGNNKVGVGTIAPDFLLTVGAELNNPHAIAPAISCIRIMSHGSGTGQGNIYLHRDDITITSTNVLGSLIFSGAQGGTQVGARIDCAASGDWGDGNSPAELQFYTTPNGSDTPVKGVRLARDGGFVVGSPTGSTKGSGTINAQAVYDDNVLLTCYVFDAAVNGIIDNEKWDGKVTDRKIPAKPATQKQKTIAESQEQKFIEVIDGVAVQKVRNIEREVPQFLEIDVVDGQGKPVLILVEPAKEAVFGDNGVEITPAIKAVYRQMVHREPIMEEVPEIPEVVKVRTHTDMRKFKARLGGDTDPLDIDKYTAHWKKYKHLTSMPNEANFDPENNLATGSWIQRLIETVEIQAVHISKLNDRLKTLEG